MAEETHLPEAATEPRKRKIGKKKGSKAKKKAKMLHSSEEIRAMKPKKFNNKMKKLFLKRAKDYNSESEEESKQEDVKPKPLGNNENEPIGGAASSSGEESEEGGGGGGRNRGDTVSDDEEHGEILPGIMKFSEGCNAFRLAFKSIIKKSVSLNAVGPVMSAHKKLVAEKLAEEQTERKAKGEAKKEKHTVIEKGHVMPANYLDTHEKFLIGVATKGVVKLFNAVNKAQNAQKGLNPSKFKDAKVIKKRRKEAFFSELGKTSSKAHASKGAVDGEGPAWAPLRDNYMLTNPKLKDWDKKPDSIVEDDIGRVAGDSSDDD
ncbi:hypothetical protein ACFX13_024912 [Malus domestica]|uniref:RRP15-like protein n=1 Tax=Malus domestica TaxID=3750 RepID=A0A498HAK7_MALDO|nr:RRP15-like protein [Malus domestica]XP_050134986.1 uncharacterized protein LOC126610882 [Malus sylvestris]RXH67860.1 hypothetical protein DVH24_028007 [Malus domestica]